MVPARQAPPQAKKRHELCGQAQAEKRRANVHLWDVGKHYNRDALHRWEVGAADVVHAFSRPRRDDLAIWEAIRTSSQIESFFQHFGIAFESL